MKQFRFDIDKKFNEQVLDKKLFRQPGFNIANASRILEVSVAELQRYVLDIYGLKSFRYLINWYRVEEAMDLWKKDEGISIRRIAQMVGYRSWIGFVYWFVKVKR